MIGLTVVSICAFVLLCRVSLSQVVTIAQDQPWPLKYEKLSKCCSSSKDHFKLLNCANKSASDLVSHPKSVAIVTYASPGIGYFGVPDIVKYSSYMVAIMAAYAEQNGYLFRLLGPETGE